MIYLNLKKLYGKTLKFGGNVVRSEDGMLYGISKNKNIVFVSDEGVEIINMYRDKVVFESEYGEQFVLSTQEYNEIFEIANFKEDAR